LVFRRPCWMIAEIRQLYTRFICILHRFSEGLLDSHGSFLYRQNMESSVRVKIELLIFGRNICEIRPSYNLAQSKVSKIPKTFTYYSRTITNLTKFDFPLPRDQTSRSRIWQMISEKFKCVTFKAVLDDVRYS
jgi:hypothetical protein